MKKQDRDEIYRRIIEHGNNLLVIFPNAAIQDPVALCKRLQVYERQAEEATTKLCNGVTDFQEDTCEKVLIRIEESVCRLLGITEEDVVFINRDPRGYALKLTEEFSKDKRIYRDWGGYGIIVPDFTPIE